ncbi:MAG: hypothetical protein AABO57_04665 [Acidobacteriota bacterium]
MACSMDMFTVIAKKAPNGKIPDGMKVTALAGPNTLQAAPACPALGVGAFTLWPLSYIDNRVSFGMVMYDPKGTVVNTVEKKGARYVYKITPNKTGNAVAFSGQSDQSVTMSLDEICQMLFAK